jgi:phenylpyruvate tautomerase PptA (4-oxalocrotonate tautomerase family)
MPLVRISLKEGKPDAYRRALGKGVHKALLEAANIPVGDEFQLITEQHGQAGLVYDANYLGIHRDDDVVFIQITLNQGRSVEVKQALYVRIADLLAEHPGVRKENIVISLVEVPKENWSFGNGVGQYV